MKSHITHRFRKTLDKLPKEVRAKTKEAYRIWQRDPYHRSLKFKKIHENQPIYSVRIGIDWRAVGIRNVETIKSTKFRADLGKIW